MQYSEEVSLELARRLSAASHRLASSFSMLVKASIATASRMREIPGNCTDKVRYVFSSRPRRASASLLPGNGSNRSLVWSYPCFRGERWCNLRLKRLKAGPGEKLKAVR